MRRLAIVALGCMALTGCANLKWLENRVVVTADCQEVHSLSKWGAVGISAEVAAADARAIVQAVCGSGAPR